MVLCVFHDFYMAVAADNERERLRSYRARSDVNTTIRSKQRSNNIAVAVDNERERLRSYGARSDVNTTIRSKQRSNTKENTIDSQE